MRTATPPGPTAFPLLAIVALAAAASLSGCGDVPIAEGAAEGTVLLGPTCPVERDPPDPACADRAAAVDLDVRTLDDRFVKAFRSEEDGSFHVELKVGQYRVGDPEWRNGPPTCTSDVFTIREGEATRVAVTCDSGIR